MQSLTVLGQLIIIIIVVYFKNLHEVHDRQTYSKNNENSKREY